jgi:hypothetical protein
MKSEVEFVFLDNRDLRNSVVALRRLIAEFSITCKNFQADPGQRPSLARIHAGVVPPKPVQSLFSSHIVVANPTRDV